MKWSWVTASQYLATALQGREREREAERERERGREAERQRQPIKRIEGGPEVFGPSDDFSVEKFGQSHRSKSAKGGWKASTRA